MVLKSSVSIFSRHCLAGSNSNVSTSPSAFLGIKSIGSSRSNTNSVFGNRPLSDSKKNLKEKIDLESIPVLQKIMYVKYSQVNNLIVLSYPNVWKSFLQRKTISPWRIHRVFESSGQRLCVNF